MTLVHFYGRGDWFIHKNEGGFRPVIQRHLNWYERGYLASELDGFFKLTEEDEAKLQILKQSSQDANEAFSILKPSISRLLPSTDLDSGFFKLVEQGKLSQDDFDKCFFRIQKVMNKKKRDDPIDYKLNLIEPQKTEPQNQTLSNHHNRSSKLMWLIQASELFWANTNRDDKSTWSNKDEVALWLISKGYSPSLAKHAATIISPDWLESGRKPEK